MEDKINLFMKNLGISRDEAIQLIADDKAVDKMTSVKEVNSDLTPEQLAAAKKARSAGRKVTVYKFDNSKREKKVNEPKKEIVRDLIAGLGDGITDLDIINDEREFTFVKDSVKYRITLAVPRS